MNKEFFTGDSIQHPGEEKIERIADFAPVVLSPTGKERFGKEIGLDTKLTVATSAVHDGTIHYSIRNEKGEVFSVLDSDIELGSENDK